MPKITEYQVVGFEDPADLSFRVNELIADGWQPFGGMQANTSADDEHIDPVEYLWQAMVKYDG